MVLIVKQNCPTFHEKRRKLYEYDKKRYPIYFNDKMSKKLWGRGPIEIEGDTTDILALDLFKLINNFPINNIGK